ncbi:MAG TPA: rod shape-determining protein RodA [Thermoleophilaceae bacterium]|nr:rod shape-determining protein RodA [Thermoleophilaceae bacterium]
MQASPYGTSVKDFRDAQVPRFVRIDVPLLLAVLGLVACSLYTIGTATQDDINGSPYYFVIRQAAYCAVGLTMMILISRFDYSRLREWRAGLYGLLIAGILLVYALGSASRGSKRAIELPFFQLQTSELGKVLLILTLSAFMVDRIRHLGDRETTSRVMLMALIPAMLVVAQPDLGTGLVYISIALATLFVAGTKWTHFAALGALGATAMAVVLIAAPAVGVQILKPYQMDRLTAFVNPSENPAKEGYQQTQSLVAIGAGGKTGRGEQATQTKLDFLPEHHTDFIFSVVGEEFGFMGAALVLSLFALLIWRCLRILTMAKNLYGTLIAGGIVAMLMHQIFVNVGMTIGIMPITGVTLPLMSYGGSSVLVTFMAIGLLQSIHAQARETAFAKGRDLAI